MKNLVNIVVFLLMFFISNFAHAAKTFAGKEVTFGNCHYIGYNIIKCKPGKCTMPLPFDTGITLSFTIWGYEAGLCKIEKKIEIRLQDAPMVIDIKCRLDDSGLIAEAEEFKEYMDGNYMVYNSGINNPILKNQCSWE